MAAVSTGADQCRLVEESQERKYDCPVCLQVLRDPCVSLCCGNNFCHPCVVKLRKADNPCPLCRDSNFRTQRNVHLSCEVYHLQVYCQNRSKGCGWVGDFGEYEVHLNQEPAMRYQFQGCHFVDIQCQYCSDTFQRSQLYDHNSVCPKRPFRCDYCQNYTSFYEDVSHNHWPVCDYYPLQCPNNCNEQILRQCLQSHIANDCSMAVIDCEFKAFGCTAKLLRGEMETHMKNSIAAHDSLVMVTKLMNQLKIKHKQIRELETKLHEKHINLVKVQKDMLEQKVSIATNEMLSTGQKQMQSISELIADFTKQNKQMEMEHSEALKKQIISVADHVEEKLQKLIKDMATHQLESAKKIESLTVKLTKQSDELKVLQQRLRNAEWLYALYCHCERLCSIITNFIIAILLASFFALVVFTIIYRVGLPVSFQIFILLLFICSPGGLIIFYRRHL